MGLGSWLFQHHRHCFSIAGVQSHLCDANWEVWVQRISNGRRLASRCCVRVSSAGFSCYSHLQVVVSLNVDSKIRDSHARLLLATFAVCLHFTQLFCTLRVTVGCLCHFEAFIHRVTNLLQCVSCVISLITLVISLFLEQFASVLSICILLLLCYIGWKFSLNKQNIWKWL